MINKNSFQKTAINKLLSSTGKDFLKKIFFLNNLTRKKIHKEENSISLVGSCLSMLYNIATCAEGTICKNNFHTIEILVGKCYDHAFSAFLLISHGFYDSSDVHVRSLAEMNNLLLLFLLKPEIYKEYYKTKPEEFSTKYASSKIRKILKKHIKEKGLGIDLPIDNIAYRNLSSYIHTEWKIPNKYSSCERGRIGGIYQQAGFKNKIQILLEHATYTIIFAIKLTNRTDLKHKFERIFIKEQECK